MMPKPSANKMRRLRTEAYIQQRGLCFWCDYPMLAPHIEIFGGMFASEEDKIAKNFTCTGDHLIPHSEGGETTIDNIVAACFKCNSTRL